MPRYVSSEPGQTPSSSLARGDVLGGARIRGDGAEHRVGMADDVLGRRLNRHVDAVLERPEVERARPGVVHQQPQLALGGDARDRRDVLHLEGLRAGAFGEDEARVGAHEIGDAGADQRIVVRRLDAELRQHVVAELARRLIDAIDHENMVAGLDEGEDGRADGLISRRRQRRRGAALDLGDGLLERLDGRRRGAAVGVLLVALPQLLDGRKEDGRAAVDRRIDEAVVVVRRAPRMDDFRRGSVRARWLLAGGGHRADPVRRGWRPV